MVCPLQCRIALDVEFEVEVVHVLEESGIDHFDLESDISETVMLKVWKLLICIVYAMCLIMSVARQQNRMRMLQSEVSIGMMSLVDGLFQPNIIPFSDYDLVPNHPWMASIRKS